MIQRMRLEANYTMFKARSAAVYSTIARGDPFGTACVGARQLELAGRFANIRGTGWTRLGGVGQHIINSHSMRRPIYQEQTGQINRASENRGELKKKEEKKISGKKKN